MEQASKTRTPSRCREWERQRRNKFNEAITKLGEVVKEINRIDDSINKDTENVQYPKIEIVQKAILCLTTCTQEITKLKAEILALHVKLEAATKKCITSDASIQVYLSIGKKTQNTKRVKLTVTQKSKRNALKEKAVTTNPTVTLNPNVTNLPKLLPRSIDKKPPENAIVVLPATPYLYPQRSLLFPTAPPAIVLVDPSMPTLNKHTVPIVTRNNGEITKTTMVNILPISAYSRPLSAIKTKKNYVKLKKDASKRPHKNIKVPKVSEPVQKSVEKERDEKTTDKTIMGKLDISESKESVNNIEHNNKTSDIPDNVTPTRNEQKSSINNKKDVIVSTQQNNIKCPENKEKNNIETYKTKAEAVNVKQSAIPTSSNNGKSTNDVQTPEEKNKLNKESKKTPIIEDKENKLPALLDTSLCDANVDGGNARLELAEEFLAASPTAAFLMSFPLVSGNRADSPVDDPPQSAMPANTSKDNNIQRRNEMPPPTNYFEKPHTNENKIKSSSKSQTTSAGTLSTKPNDTNKYAGGNLVAKHTESKSNVPTISGTSNENPFLNLSMPSLISSNCTVSDTSFGMDFDCNISKSIQNQSSNYVSNSNLFYKSDPFSTVKNTIYSTSSISSSHDFNNIGLYPCAMEKYTSKNKSDYSNVDENLMKIGSSRLTYDIDLGWSHKSFDFVNCTTSSNTFSKDNILTTVSAPYSTAYNPFNPEFHVPLVSNSNKKDIVSSKPSTSFVDTITSFYSQPTSLWSEDVPFYSNSNVTKSLPHKNQNYLALENIQPHTHSKPSDKNFEAKRTSGIGVDNVLKTSNVPVEPHLPEKFTKKSPSKMHINWMTSEIRPMESNCNPGPTESKDITHKSSYTQLSQANKKQDHNESYFPISMHNFASQPAQEEFQMWPSARPVGPTEISIEPPPINLPTLVGDLALGPHDKKKNSDVANRALAHAHDIQNCGNFLSVTQLMNRSSDNMPSRYQVPNIEAAKGNSSKQTSATYFSNDNNRKSMVPRIENQVPYYGFNDAKVGNTYESMSQFSQSKQSKTIKSDKTTKSQKNNYSAEALIRGGGCTQKIQENNNAKFIMQKYNDFGSQDNSVAQVSHFPPILDYTDNSYASQQFSGTTLYNTTTNTISNSFYSNFMPGSSNIMSTMSSNYTGGPFTSEFIDYNQADCNYTNHKYEELKIRNNAAVFPHDKVPSNYKSSRRESAAKHKLECSKKDASKKYQSKRAKLHTDAEEWNDPSHLLWQNRAPSKRHSNIMSDELTFPNYVGNQMPAQYQPEFFNSHLMPSNVQSVGHNVDRTISFPVTSRANFNLSTIFPEITMKVQ